MEDTRKVLLKQIENALYKNQDLGNVIDNDDFLTEVEGILKLYKIEQGDLRYFNINQNNVEGHFIRNDDVDAFISIQAYNLDSAKAIAREILAPYRDYCPCCGYRWDDDYLTADKSTDEPYVRGEPYKKQNDPFWCKNNKLIIYKYNGTKEIYDLNQNLKEK